MAAAGDAVKVVLIVVDYKAIRTISANVSGVRWCVLLTAAARGGLIALLAWEKSSGSGSARLGLSQKGGLPFPSETACSKRRSKAADAR